MPWWVIPSLMAMALALSGQVTLGRFVDALLKGAVIAVVVEGSKWVWKKSSPKA